MGRAHHLRLLRACEHRTGKPLKNSCVLCSAVAYCCGAVAPRAIAALLGRFLPRLGPLAHRKRPFFLAGEKVARDSWRSPAPTLRERGARPELTRARAALEPVYSAAGFI